MSDRLPRLTPGYRHQPAEALDYPDHRRLLIHIDANGKLRPARTPAHWALRRAHILAGMQQVMGPLPDSSRRVPLKVEVVEQQDHGRYVRRKITFAAEQGDRVWAHLLWSEAAAPAPGMLCLHQTTPIGKDEPAGLGGDAHLRYAQDLAERGYVCVVPDYPGFGEYRCDLGRLAAPYASTSMKAIWNNMRAVDLLQTLPTVDPGRIGCIGHSLGGHNALFTAVFDMRLKAVVSSCGFTCFHHYQGGDLSGWASEAYMPRIRDVYGNDPDCMPFDFYEVIAALAPRPLFINAPVSDNNFNLTGVKKVVRAASEVYRFLGGPDHLEVVHPCCGHDFPNDIRQRVYDWLDRSLR